MSKITIKLTQNELSLLKEHLKDYIINIQSDETLFHAIRNNCRIYANLDGQVEIHGFGSGTLALEKDINYFIKNISYDAYGICCDGLNDLFGPLVFCCAYVKKEDEALIKKLNLDLNKKITDYQVTQLGSYLIRNFTHHYVVIEPKKYNSTLDSNIKKEQILAHYAYYLASKYATKDSLILVDSFTDNANFYSYNQSKKNLLGEFGFFENATSSHYAAYISQIIARYVYLQKLNEYSTQLDTFLIKGNTVFAKNQYEELLEKLDSKVLEYAKKNYF